MIDPTRPPRPDKATRMALHGTRERTKSSTDTVGTAQSDFRSTPPTALRLGSAETLATWINASGMTDQELMTVFNTLPEQEQRRTMDLIEEFSQGSAGGGGASANPFEAMTSATISAGA